MQIPPGFERCPSCGEYNGSTYSMFLDRSGYFDAANIDPEHVVTVRCRCRGFTCRKCRKNKIHASGSNTYFPDSNRIGHWPWFAGLMPCWECAEREKAPTPGADARGQLPAEGIENPGLESPTTGELGVGE